MFRKLMKYERKSTSKLMLPLLLASIAAAVLMTLSVRWMVSYGDSLVEENFLGMIVNMGMALVIFILQMVMTGSIVCIYVLIGVRYYKNFISDEGYLTFTLPVSTGQLLGCKLLNGFGWMVLGSLALALDIWILFVGTTAESFADLVNFEGLKWIFQAMTEAPIDWLAGLGILLLCVLLLLVYEAAGLLILYLALTLGGIMAQKHKALAGVGLYIVMNWVIGFVLQIVMAIFILVADYSGGIGSIYAMLSICLVLVGAAAVGLFAINNSLLKNKLNLQ